MPLYGRGSRLAQTLSQPPIYWWQNLLLAIDGVSAQQDRAIKRLNQVTSRLDDHGDRLDGLTQQSKNIIKKVGDLMGVVQDAVDAIVVKLDKAKTEIVNEIEALKAQIAAGETPDLTALTAAAQSLDDVVPDVIVEPPVEPTV